MARIPHREYLAKLAWLDKQWNNPNRTDHYLMMLACEIWRSQLKPQARQQVKLDGFKLKFTTQAAQRPKSREEAAQWAKAKWLPFAGIKKW